MSESRSYQALMENGVFHRAHDGFKPRPAQCEMAQAVETCLQNNERLVVESGTGTGKTFAYLVPILLTGKRSIISTATKHLQEQIFHRDLPVVCDVLEQSRDAVLLKGRSNYLCRYRLRLSSEQTDLIGTDTPFEAIQQWAASTRSGDIAEVGDISEQDPIWRQVTSTADNCLGGKCPDFKQCFVMQARQRAMQARIIVVNHHLFFSDLNLKQEGFGELLPDCEAVVFDEAHELAETASRFFGFTLSSYQIRDLIDDTLASEQDEKSGGAFAPAVMAAQQAAARLLAKLLRHAGQSVAFDDVHATVTPLFARLQAGLSQLEAVLATAAPAGEGLQRCHQRCLGLQALLESWISGADRNLIRWLEATKTTFRLHATPLDISRHFDQLLGNFDTAWVFTSATLAVGDRFDAFCRQLGLQDTRTAQWHSPFDFARHSLLYLPPDIPDPRAADFAPALAEVILQTLLTSEGRAFCLFTSFAMMDTLYGLLKPQLSWPLLLQGEAPKSELLQRFVRQQNAVLFGTASFWQGVDVQGEALSCVIIDKLPFASPAAPVLKSRLAACEADGGNPFMDIQVPAAVIAFKQGAGRLIRSETDRGVLVVCDSRVTRQRYGRLFLDSLPAMPTTHRLSEVRRFFSARRTPA